MRVAAVVLAAGASTRLGRPKQLVLHEGEPLVRRAVRAAVDAGARPVVVVLGARAAEIAPALDGVAGIDVITHARWADGLGASLAAGLRALDAGSGSAGSGDAPTDGVLLTVCDQPLVDARALGALIDAFAGPATAVAAEYAGTLGVPAVIGRDHLDAFRTRTGDAGAGRWLRAHAALVTPVPMPAAAFDVDTEADVVRLGG
ncbi:MAG TPA: nucleotidyltransferase family protein [Gemmatirosa sp.]